MKRQGFLARFARHRRGVAAVELALIAPVMILGYFGLAEVTMAMMAQRRASHAASTIGDLVTQSAQMNPATMSDIFSIGSTMMRPFPSSPLQMRVTSVQMKADQTITVLWSEGYGGMPALVKDTPVADDKLTEMMDPWDSIVVTEMSYSFDSPFKKALPNALTFTDKAYLKPRRSDQVIWIAT